MSLKCALQLDIPTIIHNHGQPMKLSELAAAIPIHPPKARCLSRLMAVLVHTGFFARQEVLHDDKHTSHADQYAYLLTPASRLLLRDKSSRVAVLQFFLDPVFLKPWDFMSSWLQNDVDATAFSTAHGTTLWDFLAREPKMSDIFNETMASDSQLIASVMTSECKWAFEGLKSLVDVGGGTGTLARATADAFPQMKCTVFDLPHVVANLRGSKNLEFLGGDMFEAIPPANAILLKTVLHNWNDEESIKILQRCREAIPDNEGKVIIIDMVLENQKESENLVEAQMLFELELILFVAGRERNEKEWKKLFMAAGFSHYKIIPILGLRSLIEVYP